MSDRGPRSATYSSLWFETFCTGIDPAQTAREVDFLRRALPLPSHRKLIDVGCGTGRHALPLAQAGYDVTGLENSPVALARARQLCGGAVRLLAGDMRELNGLEADFGGVLCLWGTFGIFSAHENANVLRLMSTRLRPGGRLVLDVYDPDFFKPGRTERVHDRQGVRVSEIATVTAGRRHVVLSYDNGQRDEFDWQLLSGAALRDLAERFQLKLDGACAGFEETRTADGHEPRMQLIFVRLPGAV